MRGIAAAKSSIQNSVGKGFAVGPQDPSRSPKAVEKEEYPWPIMGTLLEYPKRALRYRSVRASSGLSN